MLACNTICKLTESSDKVDNQVTHLSSEDHLRDNNLYAIALAYIHDKQTTIQCREHKEIELILAGRITEGLIYRICLY
jgi:hypothetical protein